MNIFQIKYIFACVIALIPFFYSVDSYATIRPHIHTHNGKSSIAYTIQGTTFDDYNENGIRDAGDDGINGVTVTAYGETNTLVASATTSTIDGADGSYLLTIAANTGPTRVQFSNIGPTSTLAGLRDFQPSNHKGGTTVAFVDGTQATNTVDLGIARPEEYCQNNPDLATSCYVQGNNTSNSAHVIVRFPYTGSKLVPAPTGIALANEVGATWGLAYRRSSDSLFAAAYTKQLVSYKPGGSTGAIYLIQNADAASPQVNSTPFIDLNERFGTDTAGADPHTATDNYIPDYSAYDAVGKVALGGLALSDDETTLYTMNLFNKELYAIPVGAPPAEPTAPDAAAITHTEMPTPSDCASSDMRPFAVTAYHGLIYVGAICSAESTISPKVPLGDASKLSAYIFVYTPGSGFTNTPIFEFPLDYTRHCADRSDVDPTSCLKSAPAAWQPWQPNYHVAYAHSSYAQPMLTSIAFDHGDLIIGLRDRYGDQTGNSASGVTSGRTAGDVLRACANTSSSWTLENNGSCGGVTTGGANNGKGPGGGEYYHQQNFAPYHDYVSMGGVLQIPGAPNMINTTFDPTTNIFTGGARTYNNTTGATSNAYQLYNSSVPGNFGKANGLGGLAALCQSAPIEIGDRIWDDRNGNGIQDPGETGLGGVTVDLYSSDGFTLLQKTTTDPDGNYHFTIQPYTQYVIKVDNPRDYETGALVGYALTQANKDNQGHATDSKALLLNQNAKIGQSNFPYILVSAHKPGENDYAYDIGFKLPVYSNTIIGMVFDDYNQNGIRDAHEPGINGIVVKAYDSHETLVNTQVTSTLDGAPGQYSMSIPPGSGPLRMVFTNFGSASTIPQLVGFQPSNHTGGTPVSFVSNPQAGARVNLGIEQPAEYCQNNPQLATSCYVGGNQSNASQHVIVRFPYDSSGDNSPPTPLAAAPEVGATWGLAYRRSTDSLFAAAYIKRFSGLKPGGSTGAIYLVQKATSDTPIVSPKPFFDLNTYYSAKTAGANPHTNYSADPNTYDAVGKVGLGGIALSEDETTLYVVNLADKQLYSIGMTAPPALPVPKVVNRVAMPLPLDCVAGDFRPFAVTVHYGDVYIGAICSAESTSTKKSPVGDPTRMHGYVLNYSPSSGFQKKPVFEFALNYPRRCANGASLPNCWKLFPAAWLPWHSTFTMVTPNAFPVYPQPIFTSIAFDQGDMILGLRDRYGDQVGWQSQAPNGTGTYSGITAGDILRACTQIPGDLTSGWTLESNASCGGNTTQGKDTGRGPGGGEYYYQDNFWPFHDDVAMGGLAQIPGFSTVASTTFNPTDTIDSGGTRLFDNTTGAIDTRYRIYTNGTPGTFGKSNGLGGLVAMCQSAPIEIGHRIWLDTNKNGIQDPNEPAIAGVTVHLYAADGTTLLQSTTSDANGEYYFTIDPYKAYVIKLDNSADYSSGPLQNDLLTIANQDKQAFNTDSKAFLPHPSEAIGVNNFPQILVNSHMPGQNDSTLDIGFTVP